MKYLDWRTETNPTLKLLKWLAFGFITVGSLSVTCYLIAVAWYYTVPDLFFALIGMSP